MFLKLLILFGCIVCYKALFNFYNYRTCQRYYALYLRWFADDNEELLQSRGRIIKLLKRAGVQDSSIPTSQPIGYWQLANFNASAFDNFPSKIADFAAMMNSKFQEAIGEYRSRILDSVNPLYWIDTILFLPKHFLNYLGINQSSLSFKISNVVLSILWWAICICLAIFRPYIDNFIINFLGDFH